MTASGICELFGFAPPRDRKHGSVGKASGWKMVCALFVLCAASTIASPAQTFRTVVHFHGTNGSLGQDPLPLIQGLDGNFYGTTWAGGVYYKGTVFKITRGGTLTTLYSFCAQTGCPDGSSPLAGLVQATDGNFYGGMAGGGAYGWGTIFKITPGGTLTTLYSFDGADGYGPSSLVQATDGNIYGTTQNGGTHFINGSYPGEGTIFKIAPGGKLTTVYDFCAQAQCTSYYPGGLIQATDGNFYGETLAYTGIFKMTPAGTLTYLHNYCTQPNCTDGYVGTGLLQATDGNFYGAMAGGGAYDKGTIFKLTPGGTLTALYNFCSQTNCSDGASPIGALVQASDGNFYGTTYEGGQGPCLDGCGTVFKITPSGTLTTLHSFNGTDGMNPRAPLLQATNGTFYGTTPGGGVYGDGTVFSLCVGLGWFTEELPNYGKVGGTIDILGTNLTGASSVTFNGTAAPFTVISKSEIQATVPSGARTGYVSVTLPSGRIPSNKKFRVTPQITSFTPTSGSVGTLVTITGVSLTQTWEVTIRGVHASFTMVDDGTVTATVPTGATTGRIRIAGPGGAATSTTNFTVD